MGTHAPAMTVHSSINTISPSHMLKVNGGRRFPFQCHGVASAQGCQRIDANILESIDARALGHRDVFAACVGMADLEILILAVK